MIHFITQYNLFSSLPKSVVLLLDLDNEEPSTTQTPQMTQPTQTTQATTARATTQTNGSSMGFGMRLLLDNVDRIPIAAIVGQLKDRPKYLCQYLDGLFFREATIASEFHSLQLELYAVNQPEKLLDFLKISTFYPLEKALHVCEECGLVREQVYILGRMGNTQKALNLIITKLQDVAMVSLCVLGGGSF